SPRTSCTRSGAGWLRREASDSIVSSMKPILGNYHSMAAWQESRCRRPLSLLAEGWSDLESWRTQARAKVYELLAYEPPDCPLDAAVDRVTERDGMVTELVSWAQPFGPRT